MSSRLNKALAGSLTFLLLAVVQVFPKIPLLLAERFYSGAGWVQIIIMSVYAGWLAGQMTDPVAAQRLRPRIWLLFSLVFFSQLFLGLAGIERLLMTGRLHLPLPAMIIAGPLYRGGDFFMPILFTVTVLLVGPAWCSHLCYIGAWDDLCSRSSVLDKPLPGWWPAGRLAVLVFVVLCASLLRYLQLGWAWALTVSLLFGLAGILIMLLVSRKLGLMAHCTMFCPMGLIGNWLGRLSPWRMRISDGCHGCMQCSRVCRYSALSAENIRARLVGRSCTLCGDCVAACRSGQIDYSLPLMSKEIPRAVFVILITTLHAVFLAVARI
ncbi:MAG: 4Fe-4S ferredoxin [Candidatus Riflebacteria bacterium]|nr:4Fe-4S ferredoxin [Candidatus Riflebacteria bacterium]